MSRVDRGSPGIHRWCPVPPLLRLSIQTGGVVALLLLLAPSEPDASRDALAGPAIGSAYLVGTIALLFAMCTRRSSASKAQRHRAAVRGALIGVLAAGEELLWRRLVLCELLRWGTAAAWAASSVGFALAHRSRPALHLGTGGLFGGIYLATGSLTGCLCAHWSYNLLVERAVVPPERARAAR
jgi:membrane protease YdiL (CAAX protease family)